MNEAEALVHQRGTTHGPYTHTAAVAQAIKETMRASPNWINLPSDMKESLDLNATKVARILVGDFSEIDHWADIAGYATLISKRLRALALLQEELEAERGLSLPRGATAPGVELVA